MEPLSQGNPSISTPVGVLDGASAETGQTSPIGAAHGEVSANTDLSSERNSVNFVSEEPGEASAETSTNTDPPSQRNPSMAAVDEHVEAPAEPDVVTNMSSHRNSTTAVMNALGEVPAGVDMVIDTHIQGDFSTAAMGEQGEVPREPVLVEEIAIEIAPSAQVGAPGHGTDDGTTGKHMNTLHSLSNEGEEDAQADCADCTNCPICMEPWTGEGIHRICCLACGHLFGRSCIRRWLNQKGKKNGKCPHCNRKARVEDIRNLYVPSLTVIDDKSQQLLEELGVLRSKNEELIVQNDKLKREYDHLQAVLAASHPVGMPRETSRTDRGKSHRNQTIEEFRPSRPSVVYSNDQARGIDNFFMKRSLITLQEHSRRESHGAGNQINTCNGVQLCGIETYKRQQIMKFDGNESPGQFKLQEEFSLLGARVFDMDAFSQMLLVAQKSSAVGGVFYLNKISLLSMSDTLAMPLPQCTGAVRDIRVAPAGGKLPGRLALVASLGKMISLFSLESNNVVLTYKLQSPCWSCAWDPNEPNHVFAGLQDGGLTIFDLRQTSSPLRSLQGLCRQPVHMLHPVNECNLPQGPRRNGLLSACSSGVCFWDSTMLGLQDGRPYAVPCADNQGVCVALAYNQLANVAVATFRGKPLMHQPETLNPASEVESAEPFGMSSQANSQSSLGFHPLRATHYPLVKITGPPVAGHEARHGNDSAGTSSTSGSVLPREDMSSMNCGWKYGNPMSGYVSPVGMHRSAIVCSSRTESSSDLGSVFAFGDEETRALMLWDVKKLAMVDHLKPHGSPILDVRSMNIGEHAILGCASATTLQVYKR